MPSIVPEAGHITYLVLDEVGIYGPIWREMSDGEANEATIINWIIEGRFDRPLRVVAFNTDLEWSRDVTRHIASMLADLSRDGRVLGAAANEFIERVTGQTPKAMA